MQAGGPDVKARILAAAKKLFARQGFEATTVRQVCEEAGANVALVSYHFGGKDNLFAAMIEASFPNSQIQDLSAAEIEDPVESIRMIIRELTAYRLREPDMVAIMQQETMFDTPRREIIRKYAFPVWRYLRRVLEAGRECGVFRFGSTDHVFMLIVGAVLFQNRIDHFGPLLDDPAPNVFNARLADELCVFVLRGLGYEGG